MQGKKSYTKNEGIPGVSGVSKGFNFYATRFPGILFAKSQSATKMISFLEQTEAVAGQIELTFASVKMCCVKFIHFEKDKNKLTKSQNY